MLFQKYKDVVCTDVPEDAPVLSYACTCSAVAEHLCVSEAVTFLTLVVGLWNQSRSEQEFQQSIF